jgi:hypothetical protein
MHRATTNCIVPKALRRATFARYAISAGTLPPYAGFEAVFLASNTGSQTDQDDTPVVSRKLRISVFA